MKVGFANLPLHGGSAPPWLYRRMVALSREIIIYVVGRYGPRDFISRISHPVYFQSLGCVLGFDWHSSGLTTTATAAMKEGVRGLEKDLGLYICGGKGKTSRKTPEEITEKSPPSSAGMLIRASRLSAKVDSSALQDGYELYHHAFFFDSSGNWAVIQQGMNAEKRYARRYHWLSDSLKSFVSDPHLGVCCDYISPVLNLVAAKSSSTRRSIVGLTRENPSKMLSEWDRITVLDMPRRHYISASDIRPSYLRKVLRKTYEHQPVDFENVLLTPGMGAKTLRALTLLSEVLTGAVPSFEDPVQYAFAHGGKDGIPYPVDRALYDSSTEILRRAISGAHISPYEKNRAHGRLSSLFVK